MSSDRLNANRVCSRLGVPRGRIWSNPNLCGGIDGTTSAGRSNASTSFLVICTLKPLTHSISR